MNLIAKMLKVLYNYKQRNTQRSSYVGNAVRHSEKWDIDNCTGFDRTFSIVFYYQGRYQPTVQGV